MSLIQGENEVPLFKAEIITFRAQASTTRDPVDDLDYKALAIEDKIIISVTDKRIHLMEKMNISGIQGEGEKGPCYTCIPCGPLLACCFGICCGRSGNMVNGTKNVTTMRSFDIADLKKITYTMSNFTVEDMDVKSGGCCNGGGAIAPATNATVKTTVHVTITLVFIKRIGEYMPGDDDWSWEDSVKTSHATVILKGEMASSAEARKFCTDLMTHPGRAPEKMSSPQNIVLNVAATSLGVDMMKLAKMATKK